MSVSSSPAIGQRVELHPATDAWMRGDRYGTIVAVTKKRGGIPAYRIKMDRSGRTLVLAAEAVAWVAA